MSDVNVLVTYYSATGSVHRMAQAAVVGAEKAGGVVRLR
jgi:NAD(P)H dehydrogenase (quinone)